MVCQPKVIFQELWLNHTHVTLFPTQFFLSTFASVWLLLTFLLSKPYLEKVSFHSNQKKGNAKECSNSHTIVLISHASKVLLKILQTRLQKHVKNQFPDVHTHFRKDGGTRDQIANICWIIKRAREFQKNIYFCFIGYAKAFDCVDHNKLENSSRDRNIRPPDLPLEMYAGQEATVRTGHGTTDWFQIGKGVCQGCTLSPCLFNLYA